MRTNGLALIAAGLVLVAVDFRTTALDLLPDIVGWVLVVVGAIRIHVVTAAWCAGAAGLLSFSDLFLPYTYDPIDPITGKLLSSCTVQERGVTEGCNLVLRYESVGDLRAAAIALAAVFGAVAFVMILRALVRHGDEMPGSGGLARRGTRWIAIVLPAVWAGSYVAIVATEVSGDGYEPFWIDGLAYVSGVLLLLQLSTAAMIMWFSSQLGRSLEGPPSELRSWGGITFGGPGTTNAP